jgi:5-methylcytosine-specific restriction endonuclease McrA
MNYKEQYQHPKWLKKRFEVLERDGYKCTNCGENQKNLNVHHYFYNKGWNVWDYNSMHLTTFCDDCHNKWHEIKDGLDVMFSVKTNHLYQLSEIIRLARNKTQSELNEIKKFIENE